LYALTGPGKGPERQEAKYTWINLTDELRKLNGFIIDCQYVEQHWIFVRQSVDRYRPNTKFTIYGLFTFFLI